MVRTAPKLSELDKTFILAQINKASRLFAPSFDTSGDELKSQKAAMTRKKTERESRHQKECAAKKLIDTLRKGHLINTCAENYRRTGHRRSCGIFTPLSAAEVSESTHSRGREDREKKSK